MKLIKVLTLEEQKLRNSPGIITKKQFILKIEKNSSLKLKRVKSKVSKISAIS